jgi:choline-sulfatase
MRLLYVDVDSLRADHLGCYGYDRDTSPVIDSLAVRGVRFTNVYASDVPCLPSRTALITGRFGIRNGVVTHGGTGAELFVEGPGRRFQSTTGGTSWPRRMRKVMRRTVSISSFPERHSAFWWTSGFTEWHNPGLMGIERADEVTPIALEWLERHGREDDWFLHMNLWDPHTPYRSPDDPFASAPTPAWLTDEVRADHWSRPGPHSAQEMVGFDDVGYGDVFPRQPKRASSMDDVRAMFDGYDAGVRFADAHIGLLLDKLRELGVADDTAILVSADHGENLGELHVYGDHHTADHPTARLPAILVWPGAEPGVDTGLHYHVDLAATILERLGVGVPSVWDGAPVETPREHLVLSQAAWTVQRAVRWDRWICVRTYHDAFRGYPDVMLFDVDADPHEQRDLAGAEPKLVEYAMRTLESWRDGHVGTVDPFDVVMNEGGGWHIRGRLPAYLERLRATGRADWADRFADRA